MYDPSLLQELARLHRDGVAFCLVTIVDARGSMPQEIGAKAIFTVDGLIFGTIGGGGIELRCRAQAAALLAAGSATRTKFERLNLHKDIGMTCAGEVALYYEVHRPELDWDIVVFGAGHVAQKLCRFLVELDCRVTCVDTRADWLERLPRSDRLERRLVGAFADAVGDIRAGAAVVVMTMGHATDVPVLHAIQRRELALSYLGVIGSESKGRTLRRQLATDGLPPPFIESILCPIGDRLGDNTPGEIAVGVLTQLLRQRHHRDAAAGRS